MTNKERYLQLCESSPAGAIPLFQQHWWMDTVCQGKEWDVAIAEDSNGNLLAAMPYLLRQRFGLRYILQPQLTPFNGPYYNYPSGIHQQRLPDFEKQAVDQLVDHLKSLHIGYFQQCLSPEVTNWLPFYWHGFTQTTRYTYRIPDISHPDIVFENFDKRKERQRRIRQIIDRYTVDADISPEAFASFHQAYWLSHGKRDLLSKQLMVSVMQTSIARNQGLILGLRDSSGELTVAWFVVYDSHCAYALLSAMSPRRSDSGATPLLIWRLIQHLSPLTQAFDFEGSMNQSTAYFYRSFGAVQVPYMQISYMPNPIFRILLKMKK